MPEERREKRAKLAPPTKNQRPLIVGVAGGGIGGLAVSPVFLQSIRSFAVLIATNSGCRLRLVLAQILPSLSHEMRQWLVERA